jgi:hypothetical protein
MIAQTTTASQERTWGQIIARIWIDEDFKSRFMLDPRGVLAEYGIEMPVDIDIHVVEDTDTVRTIVLAPPPDGDLMEEELLEKNAAYCYSGHCGRCGCGCRRCGCYC